MIELLNDFRNVSIICDNEIADEIVAALYDEDKCFIEETFESVEDLLNTCSYFIISKNSYTNFDEEYVIEPLLKEYCEQYYLENDYVIVQDDLVDIVDFDVIEAEEILTFKVEECEECDELDETDAIIEEMTDDLLNSLEKEENCPHCEIKNMLTTLWNIAYESGWDEASEFIKEEVSNVFKK